jgi:hypothetical protein
MIQVTELMIDSFQKVMLTFYLNNANSHRDVVRKAIKAAIEAQPPSTDNPAYLEMVGYFYNDGEQWRQAHDPQFAKTNTPLYKIHMEKD